jgi:protein TonB
LRPTPARPAAIASQQPAPTPAPAAPAPPAAAVTGRAIGPTSPPGPDPNFRNAAPGYPEAARLRGEVGSVRLELSIGTDGRVITVQVIGSSGFPTLDATARRAAEGWRFRPALQDGQPVPGTIRTSLHFRLQ